MSTVSLLLPRTLSLLLLASVLLQPTRVLAQLPQQGIQAATPVTRPSAVNAPAPRIRPPERKPLLPASFAGEPREGAIVIHPSAMDVDAAHAAVLKEDGLVEADTAHYSGDGPVGWTIKVLRFGDATGALSAFTFYRDPAMQSENVGQNAAANPGLFLARDHAALVMVHADGLTSNPAQDATQLKPAVTSLLQLLPKIQGPEAITPTLPGLLPAPGLQVQTLHYAIGPAAYNGALPVGAIDFARDAEAVTARYRLHSGNSAMLTLLMLPTPQIAGASLRTIQALPDASLHIAVRRSGPLVGVVSGAGVSQAEAQQLLAQISYVADVTMNQPQGYISEVAKTAKLLVSIAYITAALGVAAVVIAVFLGAGRVLIRRLRGKPDSSMNDDTFISLKL